MTSDCLLPATNSSLVPRPPPAFFEFMKKSGAIKAGDEANKCQHLFQYSLSFCLLIHRQASMVSELDYTLDRLISDICDDDPTVNQVYKAKDVCVWGGGGR